MTQLATGSETILASGQADANGNVTLTFPSFPATLEYQGSINVNTQAGSFSVAINGITIGRFSSPTGYGPLTCNPGDQITLTGTGCTPSTPVVANFTGYGYPPGMFPPSFPTNSQGVQTAGYARVVNQFGPATLTGGNIFTATIPLIATDRSLILFFSGVTSPRTTYSGKVTVSGNITNTIYFSETISTELQPPSAFLLPPVSSPAYGGLDTSVTVTFTCANTLLSFTFNALALPDDDISGSPGNPIFILPGAQGNPVTTPFYVATVDGSGNQNGISGNPYVVTPSIVGSTHGNRVGVNNVATTLITAAAGVLTVVDSLCCDDSASATICNFLFNGSTCFVIGCTAGNFVANGPYPVKLYMLPGDILTAVLANATTSNVTFAYHTESL